MSTTTNNRIHFTASGKALTASAPDEDGDLHISGWAAKFDEIDRQGEAFSPNAFTAGITEFLRRGASLCYHHHHDQLLGVVKSLQLIPGEGLWLEGRVDGAIKNHPVLGTIYHQIRRGSLRNLSVGGFFKRKLTPRGYVIDGVDFTEISITPVGVGRLTSFAVVAGKALSGDDGLDDAAALRRSINGVRGDLALLAADDALRALDRLDRAARHAQTMHAARGLL